MYTAHGTNRRAEELILSMGLLWLVPIRIEQSWKRYSWSLAPCYLSCRESKTCSPLATATSFPTSSWVQGSEKPVQPATVGKSFTL